MKRARFFPLNGRYEACTRRGLMNRDGPQEGANLETTSRRAPRLPAYHSPGRSESRQSDPPDVAMPTGSPIQLRIEVFPRYRKIDDAWLLTVVLRNANSARASPQPMKTFSTRAISRFWLRKEDSGAIQKASAHSINSMRKNNHWRFSIASRRRGNSHGCCSWLVGRA